MLRNSITNAQKAVDATYKAHTALKRGMGVVKSTDGVTAFAGSLTDEGVFVVDRDNLATGINCAYSDRPDTAYDDIASGELIKLVPYVRGEQFLTDQYDAGAKTAGTAIGVDTDGKWKAHSTGKKYVSRGEKVEAGVTYLVVDVID